MVFLPDECKHTVLPRGMNRIHFSNLRNPFRLYEIALRNLYKNYKYYKMICNYLQEGMIPKHIFITIRNGPISLCGNDNCSRPLFTESYFFLLKK